MAGGVFGIHLAMYIFRHKTKHRTFTTGMPLFGAVWLCVIVVIFFCARAARKKNLHNRKFWYILI